MMVMGMGMSSHARMQGSPTPSTAMEQRATVCAMGGAMYTAAHHTFKLCIAKQIG